MLDIAYRAEKNAFIRRPTATFFHGKTIPPFSIAEYAERMETNSIVGEDEIRAGLALCRRFALSTGFDVCPLTLHRMFAVAVYVGMKANFDHFMTCRAFAYTAGLRTYELQRLEIQFCVELDYRLIVPV